MSRTHSRQLSWDEVCDEAFGECGLKPWEFYEYTFSEYLITRSAIRKHRKVQLQQEYQHVRMIIYHSLLPYMKAKDKGKKLDDIVPDIYAEKPVETESLSDKYKRIIEQYKAAGALN